VKKAALFAAFTVSAFGGAEMSFIDNGRIKVGVDLSIGGAITWVSRDGGENRINSHDFGRQIQMSYYSGPVPFEVEGQKPAEHWRHLGWNPVQAGDDFKHGSKVLEHRNDGRAIYVKCVPLQWPLNRVEGECIFESWLELDGIVLKARARLTNRRSDRKQYEGRHQELPALYANAPFYRVVSYTGPKPFSGGEIRVIEKPKTKHPWAFWSATEQWSALLDDSDNGVGLISPGRIDFTGGFSGKAGANDPFGASTGYLASKATEIIDFNIVHEYRYEVVAGNLAEIRARAAEVAKRGLPAWDFSAARHGWSYRNAVDTGWPVRGALDIQKLGDDPQLLSPDVFWNAVDAPFLVIDAAFQTSEKAATVYCRRHGENPGAPVFVKFPIVGDGQFRRYVVRLADVIGYEGAMVGLRLDPFGKGQAGDFTRIRSIALSASTP
jgi:hypothetical protein